MVENIEKVGATATVELGGLTVLVTVRGYKRSYGRDRWLVTPVAGSGSVWVEKVTFDA